MGDTFLSFLTGFEFIRLPFIYTVYKNLYIHKIMLTENAKGSIKTQVENLKNLFLLEGFRSQLFLFKKIKKG